MSFGGARVLAFESRRASEIGELIKISGGQPFSAPSLVEAPLEENGAAFDFADRLYGGEYQMVILLTGVGTRFLQRVISAREPGDRLIEALRTVTVVSRSPKSAAVLREWGVPVSINVPEPNTWHEVLKAVEGRPERSVAVQEYGRSNPDLIRGLEAQGRQVTAVPVYQWKLPVDTTPLAEAVQGLVDSQYQVAMFTTGVQIDHVVQFAGARDLGDRVIEALKRTFVASVGPDCSEALRSYGIEPDFEPSRPKMGFLVRQAAEAFQRKQN